MKINRIQWGNFHSAWHFPTRCVKYSGSVEIEKRPVADLRYQITGLVLDKNQRLNRRNDSKGPKLQRYVSGKFFHKLEKKLQ